MSNNEEPVMRIIFAIVILLMSGFCVAGFYHDLKAGLIEKTIIKKYFVQIIIAISLITVIIILGLGLSFIVPIGE